MNSSISTTIRSLPEWHPVRTGLRLIKNSPRLITDDIVKHYVQYRLEEPLTIVVLGMHRSGTSVVTRIINMLGARVGRPLVGANSSNPKGHWEHQESLCINQWLLDACGGSWDSPPEEVTAGVIARWRMRLFIADLHNGTGLPAVWKDPRTLLTFSEWRSIIRNCLPVFVFRNPISVARSLHKRNNLSLQRGVNLWLKYNQSLLEIARNQKNAILVDFDKGKKSLKKMAQDLSHRRGINYDKQAVNFYDSSISSSSCAGEMSESVSHVYESIKDISTS